MSPPNAVLPAPARRLTPLDAWDMLERLGRQLQACPGPTEYVRLTLETIRRATGADAVFWYPGLAGGPVIGVGDRTPDPEWCRAFAAHHTEASPELGSRLASAGGDGVVGPHSVAMVRVSRSRSLWLVALGFDPARPLRPADLKVMALARRILVTQRCHLRSRERLRDTLLGLVRSLTAALNAKSPYTCGHSERVARAAVRLGQEMGLSGETVGNLYLAGLLHDVGKIGIHSSVLQSPRPLTAAEEAHVREHPVIGERIVAAIPALAHLRPGVRHHHERHDGLGYPDGLAGEAVPLMARILAVADACDAMTSDRPYRPALPPAEVDVVLAAGAGRQWDPEVIRHFLRCRADVYGICQKGLGDSVLVAVEEMVRTGEED